MIEDRARADMGSWRELADFVRWSKRRWPARRYALVLWDHGNGWKPLDPANAPQFHSKSFSLDDETGNEISTPQIALALKEAGAVDFLMLDGCNMAMASVAYELRDQAQMLTASEEMEPGVVVRYAQFLGALHRRPEMGAEEFAVNTVRTYRDYFSAGGEDEEIPVTQSALRLPLMGDLRRAADAWVEAALRAEPAALLRAKRGARTFGDDPDFKDLYDLVRLAGEFSSSRELKSRGLELMRFLEGRLVAENWSRDPRARGLAVYVPDRVYDPLYDGLSWSRDGRWDDFARFMAGLR